MEGRNILFCSEKSDGGGNKGKKDNISISGSCNEDLLLLYTKKIHGGDLKLINPTISSDANF